MKILVTGGAGFIGSNIVDAYLEAGHEVAILDNLITGKKENLNPKAKFYQIDIRDKKVADILLDYKPEIINHLAAQIDVRKSVIAPAFTEEVNVLGAINLLDAAVKAKVKKIVFSSTGGALYGEIPEKEGADEDHKLEPISPYAITKKATEMYLYFYYVTYGIKFTVLRYGNVYGPRQDPLGEAGVIAIFIGKLAKGENPTIFGDGKQLRDYVYVGDVCQANLIALKAGDNQTYNVGTGIGTSVNELFEHLKNIMKFKGSAVYAPPRAGELFRSVLNCKKIIKELGWKPTVNMQKDLELTVKATTHLRQSFGGQA